jgi:ribonuclease T
MVTDVFICVDVETAGAYPAKYAMLSIGACLVTDIGNTFYVELKPDRDAVQSDALAISGLNMDKLRQTGQEPKVALSSFADWIRGVVPEGARPLFVAFNAPFDWMFINDYFQRYLGMNPFGHSALDIKAYFMGQQGVDWAETSMQHVSRHFLEEIRLSHNALRDAQDQAEIFRKILKLNPRFNLGE